ncbi:HAD family hydrolase [Streptomyces sp. NPDC059564]|uniref:HAD family hydrolase n=1 Tax=Streptomyces sp. NPDC059564 TaxID=3346865 RepID=UPI00369E139F
MRPADPGLRLHPTTIPTADSTRLPPVRAVVCDLDHTLTPQSSVVELSRALGAPIGEVTALYRDYQAEQLTHGQIRTQLLELWTRAGLATRTTIESVFHQLPIKDDALRLAAALMARGLPLCLITSSAQLYANIMTGRLQATCGYGNGQLHFNTEGFLEDLDFTRDTADLKLRQLRQFTAAHGLKPGETVAIGNGSNDLLMFDATGRGVLVTTTTSTRHTHRAWATVRHLDEVIPLIDAGPQR